MELDADRGFSGSACPMCFSAGCDYFSRWSGDAVERFVRALGVATQLLPVEEIDARCANLAKRLEPMVRDLLDDTNFLNAVGQGLAVVDAITGMEEMVWRSALRHGVRLCRSPSTAIRAIRRMMLKLDDEDIEHWQTQLAELIRWIITGAAASESTNVTPASVEVQ